MESNGYSVFAVLCTKYSNRIEIILVVYTSDLVTL